MNTNEKMLFPTTKPLKAWPDTFQATWQSPSNIALVKYWGKYPDQIPANPSMSMTLQHAHTITSMTATRKDSEGVSCQLFMNGQKMEGFESRLVKYLQALEQNLPLVAAYHFKFDTKNTFPHAAGIASSASAYSAIALCLNSLYDELLDEPMSDFVFRRQASFMARIGSGSACRSIYGGYVEWGASDYVEEDGSNLYAIDVSEGLMEYFGKMKNAIAIVSEAEKPISSSKGHQLMEDHAFREARIEQANENLGKLLQAMHSNDRAAFCGIVEEEALSLHAMMLASRPGYFLLQAQSMEIIKRIRQFRQVSGVDICFTLDAGPNVHILYFEADETEVSAFITNEIAPLCQRMLYDTIGDGPKQLA